LSELKNDVIQLAPLLCQSLFQFIQYKLPFECRIQLRCLIADMGYFHVFVDGEF